MSVLPTGQSGLTRESDLAPDLVILVHQKERSHGIELSFQLKARDPALELNYAPFGPVSLHRPEELLRGIIADLEKLGQPSNVKEGRDRLDAKGSRLSRELLPRDLLAELWRVLGRVKTVQVLSDEGFVPWELLKILQPVGRRGFRNGPFLSEAFALTRWIPDIPERLHLPVRRLAIIAAREPGEPVDEELAFLLALARPGREVEQLRAHREPLVEAMAAARFDGWHFSGHAGRPPQDPERSSLPLEGYSELAVEDLHGLAGELGRSHPLVFLNACHTGRSGVTLSGWTGWSRRLIEAGAGAFLGSSWAIPAAAAALFARSFYRGFLGGLPIGEAVRRARFEVRDRFPNDSTWLAYTVYAHPLASCREPASIDTEECDVGSRAEFQETFALYRMIETYEPDQRQWLRLGSPSDRAEFALGLGRERELWAVSERELKAEQHLERLFDLGSKAKEKVLAGSVQRGPLDSASSRIATFFSELRACRELGQEVAQELVWETARAPEINRAIRTLTGRDLGFEHFDLNPQASGSLFRFAAFDLRGYELDALRQKTLGLLASRLGLPLLHGEGAAALYAHHAGPALTLLRAHRGREVPCALLIQSLQATAAGSAVAPDPTASQAGIEAWLKASRALADEEVHARAVRLGQLFVRPRAWFWKQHRASSPRHSGETVTDALDWLFRALVEQRRAFTLVLGDFGHGKTTLLRYMAATLAALEEPEAPIPVYLPLREFLPHVSFRETVSSRVSAHFQLTDALWHGRRWILLCDGFDELGIVHQDRMDWVAYRFTTLVRESRRSNVQVVVASRPILFLDPGLRRDTVACFDRLELRPFAEEQIREWLAKWSQVETAIPFAALEQRNLIEVAGTPVLLLMIAMMFHEELKERRERYSRAEIYGRFFDWTAKWGGLAEPETGRKHPVPESYRELLREIAWILSTHPDAASGLIHYQVLLAELRTRFSARAAAPAENLDERLFVAHAFHEDRPLHIEFIHQSLREYLVAEKLLEVYRRLEQASSEDAAYETILCDRPLTLTTVRFFRELLEDLDPATKNALLPLSRNRYHWPTLLFQMAEKAPRRMTGFKLHRWRDNRVELSELYPENHVALANLSLLGFLFETYLANALEAFVDDFPEHLLRLQSFLASDPRLDSIFELLYHALERLFFGDLHFKGLDFDAFQLTECRIEGGCFEGCSFADTDFRYSKITGDRERALFIGCEFDRPKLYNVELHGVEFLDCTFLNLSAQSGSQFSEITYRQCRFVDCGIGHFYRGGRFEACTFVGIEPLPAELPIPDVNVRFEKCVVFDPAAGWRPVSKLEDLVKG